MSERQIWIGEDALFPEHLSPAGHPERPARLEAAGEAARVVASHEERFGQIPKRDARLEEMCRTHHEGYLTQLKATQGRSGHIDADTFFSPRSFEAARRASGRMLALTDGLIQGECDAGMLLARPPGHHARAQGGMGFCLINHIAVAAHHALAQGLERVLILDWDVHHGNGTEEIFEEDPRVFYVSLHQSPQYPGTGASTDVGRREGEGYTLNVPLSAGADQQVYEAAFERIVLPAVEQFAPQLTLVSAGYDAHVRDPLGGMALTGLAYEWMTRRLCDTVTSDDGLRLGLLLEGGYDLQGLQDGVMHTLRALIEEPEPTEAGERGAVPSQHEAELALALASARRHWKL